jgi:AP-4 complex subunit mu-1
MISTFFVLSPRGDTIIAKQYRNDRGDAGAHERSHTEAFFRKIKFWDDRHQTPGGGGDDAGDGAADEAEAESKATGDAPPVFIMPDGLSYLHVKRNGLIFGCATARNVSAVTVIEVSINNNNNMQAFAVCCAR